MKRIYLDYAAATPVLPAVRKAMEPFFEERFFNASAGYLAAKAVRQDIEIARASVANRLGARPSEIVFTAGGTEANNLAIHGVMRQYPKSHMVTTAIEHESVLAPAHEYDCTEISVKPSGILDLKKLASSIGDKTVLVSIIYANNEIGTIQPLRQAAKIIETIRKNRAKAGNQLPIYFHTDAAQAANYLDLHTSRLGVDLMTINSGKIYGPKQCGALFVRAGVRLKPLISGGGQERKLRSGTENTANITGFAKALDIAQADRHDESARLAELQRLFYERLKSKLPEASVNGSQKHRLPNNVHITIPGSDNERLMMALDEKGIQAAVGSACSASSEEPSHVLAALGLSEADARASLRFSMGRMTTEAEVNRTINTLADIVNANR